MLTYSTSQTFKFDNIELGWKLSIPKFMSINLVLQNPELTKAGTNDSQAASYQSNPANDVATKQIWKI